MTKVIFKNKIIKYYHNKESHLGQLSMFKSLLWLLHQVFSRQLLKALIQSSSFNETQIYLPTAASIYANR